MWPFFALGIFVPGASQILYVHAIRLAGASRTGIAIGASPLLAALLALGFLGEPFSIPLAIGTLLTSPPGSRLPTSATDPTRFGLSVSRSVSASRS